jgi:hypothetical protein
MQAATASMTAVEIHPRTHCGLGNLRPAGDGFVRRHQHDKNHDGSAADALALTRRRAKSCMNAGTAASAENRAKRGLAGGADWI